jgi:hypothetical protein
MDVRQLSGYYTFRSFINDPSSVNDFNQLKYADESELYINVRLDGGMIGMLSLPAQQGSKNKLIMDVVNGKVINQGDQFIFEFDAKGRANTAISDYSYSFKGSVSHPWKDNKDQKVSLLGTILRLQDHGSGDQIAKAGATASFLAIQRKFVEPRDIPEIAIIPTALKMISSKEHRLIHAVWHTLRGRMRLPDNSGRVVTTWYILDDSSKIKVRELGWYLDRPPFTQTGALILDNGAGEDFLFMHRKMITMIRDEYKSNGIPYIQSWKSTALPSSGIPQYVYAEIDDPANEGKKIFQLNPLETGNMVPLPPFDPIEDDNNIIDFMKSSEFFNNVMRHIASIFSNPRYLATLSLGALGNMIEFTIHGWMHNRWAHINGAFLPDPNTGNTIFRDTFDFDPMWDDPKYDYLGEFYSSHVNPLFWRLHGWVDDRIEDWFNAHQLVHAGEIERHEIDGVSWFKKGNWVQVDKPFYWPSITHHNHHHDNDDSDNSSNENNGDEQRTIDDILKVMDIIKEALDRQATQDTVTELESTSKSATVVRRTIPGGSMNFMIASSIMEDNKAME